MPFKILLIPFYHLSEAGARESLCYQAVHYDKETDSTITWIGQIKNALKGISSEADRTFKQLSQLDEIDFNKLQKNQFKDFIKENELADKSLVRFLEDTDIKSKNLERYQQYLKDTTQKTSRFSSFTAKAGGVLKSFGAGLASMGVNMGIGIGFEALISLFNNIANSAKYAKESSEEFVNSVDSVQSAFAEGSSKIEELDQKYQELSSGVNEVGENVSLTNTQYDEYKSVVKQISDLMPNLTTQINSQGEAIGFVGGKLDSVTAKYKKYRQAQAVKFITEGDDEGKTYGDVVDAYNKSEQTEKGEKNFFEQWISNIVSAFTNDSETEFSDREAANLLDEMSKLSSKEDVLKFYTDKSKQYNSFNDLVGYNWTEISAMDDASFQKFRENMAKKSQGFVATIEQTAKNTGKAMSEYAISTDEFWDMDSDEATNEKMQTYITTFLSGIDRDFINENKLFTVEDQQVFVDNLISSLSENKGNISDAFKELFALNIEDMNIDDAREKIQQFCTIIAKQLNMSLPTVQRLMGFGNFFNTASNYDKTVAYASNGNYKSAKGIKGAKGFDQNEVKSVMDKYSINTDEEIEKFRNILDTVTTLTDAVQEYNRITKKSTPKSFTEVWKSIGKSGSDEDKKTDLEEKKKLEELAEAGKLTKEKLKNSSLAEEFTKAGVSIEEATDKINKMKSSVTQLASMKTGISSISSILGEKEENLSNKKTKKQGIGIDTLEAMPDDVKSQTAEYEHFVEVLGNGKSTMNDCKDAANKLATAYVNSNNFLANLTDETGKCDEKTKQYYTSVLKEMGVENASSIVKNKVEQQQHLLTAKKDFATEKGKELTDATYDEILAFATEKEYSDATMSSLIDLALEKEGLNNFSLDTSKDVDNLIKLGERAGITASQLATLNMYKSMSEKGYGDSMSFAKVKKEAEKVGNAIIKSFRKRAKTKIKIDPINISRDKGTGKDPKSDNKSNSKQTFDWIERRLGNLQKVIDLTAAKFQNIFKIGKQKSNLDKQIKTTKQLIKEYGLAAEKYQTKANKIAAGKKVKGKKGKKNKVKNKLSKGIIKKIKTGKLTKKTKVSSLIKAYGSDKAEQIQSYIDYYDKAQSAKKSKVEQITKQRELKQQKLQLDVDLYNERISRAEAKEAVAIGTKKKNDSVNKQIKNIQLSYDKQIAIAKLTKGEKSKAEIDRLNYEKQKKITDLKVHQIDNIKKDYENKLIPFDNAKQKTQNEVSLLEAKGRIVTANYYRKQNDQEINKRNTLQNELKELQGKLSNGTFTEYSDEWYQLKSDIQSVENSINECDVNIVENSKKLGELHDAMLEDIAANNTRMASEADFLAGLMGSVLTDEDSKGLTKEGLGVLGTYGIGLETAEKNADTYAKERVRLEKLLSSGSYGRTNDEYQSEKSLRDKIAEVAQKQQEYTKTAYDYETKIADLMKENYQAQLDYMKKIIDAKKNVLSLEKDLYDYERNISNQTKNIAALEKRYSALQGDDSEEGRARQASLQAEIDEARQELQDTEYDRYISDQQNMLDNLYTEYEDLMDNLFKDQNQLLKDGIDAINQNGTTIKGVIDSYAKDYGYKYTGEFKDVVDALGDKGTIVTSMKGAINGDDPSAISKVLKEQAKNIINAYKDVKNPKPTSNPKPSSSGFTITRPDGSTGVGQHSTEWNPGGSTVMEDLAKQNAEDFLKNINNFHTSKEPYKDLSDLNKKLWNLNDNKNKKKWEKKVLSKKKMIELSDILGIKFNGGSKSENLYQRLKKLKVKGFKHGGVAKLVKAQGEDGLAMVRNGEGLISPENVAELQKFVKVIPTATDLLNNIKNMSITSKLPTPSHLFGDVHFDFENIELPNVENAQDFVSALKNDRRVREAFTVGVHDLMTKGRITNKINQV